MNLDKIQTMFNGVEGVRTAKHGIDFTARAPCQFQHVAQVGFDVHGR